MIVINQIIYVLFVSKEFGDQRPVNYNYDALTELKQIPRLKDIIIQ